MSAKWRSFCLYLNVLNYKCGYENKQALIQNGVEQESGNQNIIPVLIHVMYVLEIEVKRCLRICNFSDFIAAVITCVVFLCKYVEMDLNGDI